MKLTDRERQAYELGFHEGAAQAATQLGQQLRATALPTPLEQGLLARMREALLWEVHESWRRRVERVVAQLEQQVAAAAPQKAAAKAALERPLWWQRGLR